MLRPTLAALAMLMAAGAAAEAPREYLERAAQREQAAFAALDRNRDGRVTREEVEGDIDMTARFNDFDINRDDVIDRGELARFVQARYGVVIAADQPAK